MEEFKSTVFDEYNYNSELSRLRGLGEECLQAIVNVREEIDVDLGTLIKMSQDEKVFAAYFRDMRDAYLLKVGRIPKTEKMRICQSYQAAADTVYPNLVKVKNATDAGLVLTEKNGKVSVDGQKAEEVAKERSTTRVDAEQMGEYYKKVMGVLEAMQEVQDWERGHGVPVFCEPGGKRIFTRKVSGNVLPAEVTLETFLKKPSKELFFLMFADVFKKKKGR